jgi:hypothetical protein
MPDRRCNARYIFQRHACCCSIEGGAIVARGAAIWDLIAFQFLLQRQLVSENSLDGHVMRVQGASTSSMCTLVETQDL